MRRVLGYVRVSTNKQDLERQKVLIRNYCKRNDFDLIGFEEDFAISGTVNEREGLDRVLKVDNHIADMVVVSELSRLSRQDDILETLKQIQQIIKKVDLVILDDESQIYKAGEIFGTDLMKFLSLAFKAYGAADERKKISGRMQSGIDTKFANCVMMGLKSIPFGFKNVDNPDYIKGATARKLMVVDEETIEIVKDMYQYVLDGLSLNQITERVNSLNLGGKRFEVSNVRFILHNPVYKGLRKFRGEYYEMPVKIIDEDTWQMVQEKLLSNRAYNYTAQKKHINPLKGIAKCPCGANMMITFVRAPKGGGYIDILSCANKVRRLKTGCTNGGIRAEYLYRLVWDRVKRHAMDEDFLKKSNERVNELKAEIAKIKYSLSELDRKIDDENKALQELARRMARVSSDVLFDKLTEQANELEASIKKLEKDKQKRERNIVKLNDTIADLQRAHQREQLDNITEEGKAEIYQRLLRRVTYYQFKGHHQGYIEIVFKNGFVTKFIYANSNVSCYIWKVPRTFTVDVEKQTISELPKPARSKGMKFTLNMVQRVYTLKEFKELWKETRIQYK